jgi:hypothetical protein
MKTWPVWKRGNVLKAEHLLGAEDYLLARWALAADPAPGVDQFHPTEGVAVAVAPGKLVVTLSAVSGLTTGGQPVVVEPSDPLPGEIPIAEARAEVLFDLAVAVNAEGAATKLALRAAVVDQGSPIARGKSELFLGRFRWVKAGGWRLTRRPMVRRLSALPDAAGWHDQSWREWVAPVQKALDQLFGRVTQPGVLTTPAAVALYARFHEVAYDWPRVTVPELVHSLRYLGWLADRIRRPAEPVPALRDLPLFPTEEPCGDDLPTRLAAELGPAMIDGPDQGNRQLQEGADCTPFVWNGVEMSTVLIVPLAPGRLELRCQPGLVPGESVNLIGPGLYRTMKREPQAVTAWEVYATELTDPLKPGALLRFAPIQQPPPGTSRPQLWHRPSRDS